MINPLFWKELRLCEVSDRELLAKLKDFEQIFMIISENDTSQTGGKVNEKAVRLFFIIAASSFNKLLYLFVYSGS